MIDAGGETAPGSSSGRAVIVGPGRVGLTLAEGLHAAGTHRTIQLVGREESPPPFLAGRPGISYRPAAGWTPPDGPGPLELFLTVPDRSLREAARVWAARLDDVGDPPVHAFHTSGAHPAAALDPLRKTGAATAVFHPLRAVSAPEAGGFAGAWFGLEGDGEAVGRGRSLAAAMGARVLRVRTGASVRYHAAAVLASNLLVGCLALAGRELEGATGASGAEVERALRDLASSALRSVDREGLDRGLTGPLARGDLETVERHLAALEDPATREAYAALTRALARHALGLDGDELADVEALLERSTPAGRSGAPTGECRRDDER